MCIHSSSNKYIATKASKNQHMKLESTESTIPSTSTQTNHMFLYLICHYTYNCENKLFELYLKLTADAQEICKF